MKKILTVDDSNTMRQMVIAMLAATQFKVMEAKDGQEALEVASTTQFDLIISDINMPNLDGIELVKALRKLPAYKFIPILMLTTENAEPMKEQSKAAGATGWINKPFNPDQLLQVIKRVLR